MPKATRQLSGRSATNVALGEVVEIITQYWDRDTAVPERLVAGEHIDEGDLRVRRWGMTDDDLVPPTFNRWFQSGDVLLHSRNIKKIARPDFRGITGEKLFILRSKSESVLLQELLPFILQSATFQTYAESRWAGSTNKFLNKGPLEEFEFALPPIEEQRRLSRVLVAADAVWHSLDRLADQLKAVRQSLIDECSSVADDSIRLGELCQMQNGRPFPGDEYCESGLPLLRPGNLGADGYFDWSDEKTKRVPHHYATEATSFLVRRGDIVINLTAQSLDDGFMGRVCMATGSGPSLLNQRIGRFVDFSALILPEFLFRCLQSSRFVAHAAAMCEGSKIKHLFWPHIACFELPRLSTAVQAASCKRLLELDLQIRYAHERSAAAAQLRAHALDSAWRRGAEAIA
jgi:type I restriction enzyme S subunit